ncbi:hypothetical protein F9L16_08600 [Agarivorans sp. B2Z047]|uniref:hypothetical protein n=1 Tax=Agarivorans sp. B2Z047 TaxID=2652721 RepID=UPI00128C15EE|nr:hypothetical protein [Agarivorans sp. B2Z047]MPW29053.1 hypothetical protein [Agarivorans sp. B2Z047]UQN41606.1 hypothetical protein LQZ07_17805 [Agarivorans sp. B2Z047]
MFFKHTTFKAKITLLLLAVLLATCLAKNLGLSVSCPSAHLADEQSFSSQVLNEQSCHFTEHLLKQYVQTLEQVFVVVLFAALALVVLPHLSAFQTFLKPTIPPPRRMYRSVCHFRE